MGYCYVREDMISVKLMEDTTLDRSKQQRKVTCQKGKTTKKVN